MCPFDSNNFVDSSYFGPDATTGKCPTSYRPNVLFDITVTRNITYENTTVYENVTIVTNETIDANVTIVEKNFTAVEGDKGIFLKRSLTPRTISSRGMFTGRYELLSR